jgi:DNA-binding MltR family transcriptional regulator
MQGTRKQVISLRVATTEIRMVKKLAQRLGVRDSDVIRFAVKTMLARVAPLCDDSVRGRALLPVFIEAGTDLVRHFDLDTSRLQQIINEGAEPDQAIDADDVQLIALASLQQSYGKLRLDKALPGMTAEAHTITGQGPLSGELRGYLYSKYTDAP